MNNPVQNYKIIFKELTKICLHADNIEIRNMFYFAYFV
jgi:hypothetical protein